MAVYRRIEISIWSDPWFEGLTTAQKLLFVYLTTNERCRMSGIYEASAKRIAFETGLPAETVGSSLAGLAPKVKTAGDWVWVVNFTRYQGDNQAFRDAARKEADTTPFAAEWRTYYGYEAPNDPPPTVAPPTPHPPPTQGRATLHPSPTHPVSVTETVTVTVQEKTPPLTPPRGETGAAERPSDLPAKPARTREEYSPEFETFWSEYPARPNDSKGCKKTANAEWHRLTPEQREAARVCLGAHKRSRKWADGFSPDCERYLKNRVFESPPEFGATARASPPNGRSREDFQDSSFLTPGQFLARPEIKEDFDGNRNDVDMSKARAI